MDLWNAILLGVVQGVTEFLPISSSGHLVILNDLLNIKTEYSFLFNIVVHLGTLLAIIYYYIDDIKELLKGLFQGSKDSYLYIFYIFLATLPIAFIGVIFNDKIKSFNNNPEYVSYFLLFTGLIVFLSKYSRDKNIKLNYLDIIIIGLCQAIAILPGVSRSGMTIAVALLLGINKNKASKLSFFMAIPAIIGATILEITKIDQSLPIDLINLIIGFGVSALIGYFSISWLIRLINKLHFWKFSLYTWIVGLIMLVFYGYS